MKKTDNKAILDSILDKKIKQTISLLKENAGDGRLGRAEAEVVSKSAADAAKKVFIRQSLSSRFGPVKEVRATGSTRPRLKELKP